VANPIRNLWETSSRRRWLALCWACIALFGGPARAATLTLAVADIPYSAPVLIAEAEGYFAAEGLALDIKHYPVGRICLERLLAGEAHFATVADTPIMLPGFSRRDFAILATTTVSGRENQIVVRTDRGIQKPADLQGKWLGVIPGTSGHYFADTFLLFHGVKGGTVTEQALDAKDPLGPLVRGEVDAAALFGTHATEALHRLGPVGRVMPAPAFFSVTFNIVSRPANQGVSDDDAVKLLRAVQRAIVLLQREPERGRAIVATALKVPVADLAMTWENFEFRLQLSQPLVTTLEAEARWALRRRLVPAGVVPDYLNLVRTEPLRRLDASAMRIVK
jgi:ABC-type nitrate/sulfonate/bicarbonate transport system substrate-binding protein